MFVMKKNHDIFYTELYSLVRRPAKHNFLIIGGDMNTQIIKSENNTFSKHNSSNKKGEFLISL